MTVCDPENAIEYIVKSNKPFVPKFASKKDFSECVRRVSEGEDYYIIARTGDTVLALSSRRIPYDGKDGP